MTGMVGRLALPFARRSLSPFSSAVTGHAAARSDASTGLSTWLATVPERREKAIRAGIPIPRLSSWGAVLMMVFACVPTTVGARQGAPDAASLPLDVMSHADAERVGAVGTGCTWRDGWDRKARLSMADDRAAVRRNGVVIAVRPAADAKALFFTYDRWIGDGMHILVRDTGKVVRRGREFSETIAWLDLTMNGQTRAFRGHLNCGS